MIQQNFKLLQSRHLLVLWLLVSALWPPAAQSAPIQGGEINLQNWQSDEILPLKGEWHFFWNELLSPEQLVRRLQAPGYQAHLVTVGEQFRALRNDGGTDDIGFATYALVIHNLPKAILALSSLSTYNGGRLYIFQASEAASTEALVKIGEVGSSKEKSQPATTMAGLATFLPEDHQTYYLLIQVSNFHFNWGGMWVPPTIGSYKSLAHVLAESQRLNFMSMGMFVILLIYNASFYLRRREDKSSLYLALFCLVIIFRAQVLINWSADEFANLERSFEFHFKSTYVTQPLLGYTSLLFARACFPNQISVWLVRAMLAIFAVPVVIVLLTPPIVFGAFSDYFKFASLAFMFPVTYGVFKAVRARELGAWSSFLGGLCFTAGATFDIGSSLGWWTEAPTNNATGMGMVAFCVFQSQIVAIRFAAAFRKSEHLSRSLAEEVERQTLDIKSILKNIRQGIFTLIPPNKKLGDQYSDHLLTILGKTEASGLSLDQLLFDESDLSRDSRSQINAILDASFGETSLAFEMNEANLTREILYQKTNTLRTQILELDWNPVVNKQDEVEKILVSLRDVTEVRQLKDEAEKREEDMRILIELIQIPEDKFQRFLVTTNQYLTENREIINCNDGSQSELIKRLFMNMHTIKGAARSLAFKAISTIAHDVEQYYSYLQKNEENWDRSRLNLDLEEIHKVISHYQEVGEERLGWNTRSRIVKIEKPMLEANLKFLLAMSTNGLNPQQILHFSEGIHRLGQLCFDPLSTVITEAARGLDSIARDLHKEVPVTVIPPDNILITDQGAAFVHSILLHLFRNSMDHGIESPQLRLQRGKSTQGKITISCSPQQNGLHLAFSDDGNGLDLCAIEEKAKELKLIPTTNKLSDSAIAALIFESGFSTKNAVSEISGRGVGLDAVRNFCAAAGAPIAIKLGEFQDRHRVAFSFELTLPKSLFWQIELDRDSTSLAS